MTFDTILREKAIQLLIKARGSSRGNTGSTPHFESGESPELVFLKLLWATWGLLTSPHFEDVG
jgi:hypothetical protein